MQAYVGDIQFNEQELIQPGETKIVKVRFLRRQQILKFIFVGQKWLINEGPRVVAEGEIIELL